MQSVFNNKIANVLPSLRLLGQCQLLGVNSAAFKLDSFISNQEGGRAYHPSTNWVVPEVPKGQSALTPEIVKDAGPVGFPIPTPSGLPPSTHYTLNVSHKIAYDHQHHARMPLGAPSRRAFIYLTLTGWRMMYMSVFRTIIATCLITLQPNRDKLQVSNLEVDISKIEEGNFVTVKYRGKPVYVWHRSQKHIEVANSYSMQDLRDPEFDEQRVVDPKWLVVLAVCTHLGCAPVPGLGEYPLGFFCPCHGSHYDASGRIRKGPAPTNLEIPPHRFADENTIVIGEWVAEG